MARTTPLAPELDISQEVTGPLAPMEWGDINSALLAPRARHGIDPHEWVQTAIERAYRERLDGQLRFHGIKNGLILYGAPWRGNPKREYRVAIDIQGHNITCTCPLRLAELPCPHVGAAMILLRNVQHDTATRACNTQRQIDIWAAALHG